MPDFDINLQSNIKNTKLSPLDIKTQEIKELGPTLYSQHLKEPASVFDLISQQQQLSSNLQGVPVTYDELESNKRYKYFNPTIGDYEDFAAYGQSRLTKAANGVLKGLNLAGTTVVGGFGTLYGVGKAMLPGGKLSDVWDNPIMKELDEWNEKVDNEYLPNYYTNIEKDSKWYSTDNWFTTNFLFDKLIKNSGYAVGAMLGGNIANFGLLKLGKVLGQAASAGAALSESSQAFKIFTPILRSTSRAFSSGKNIEVAAALEKEISNIADVVKIESEIAKIASATNQFSKFSDGARRTAIAIYSSAGESNFEALQTVKEYRNNLIQKYKDENNGEEPTVDILNRIDSEVAEVGRASFLGNLALLSITEFKQLPYLIGSSYKNTRHAANNVVEDVALKEGKYISTKIPSTTRFGKLYKGTKDIGRYVFDPKESFQEIGQFALQIGSQNYYNKAKETNNADIWVDGILYGFFGEDERGEGIGAFTSKEGIESGILGGITGGLMQAIGRRDEIRGKAKNTEQFINSLNSTPTFRDAFKDKLAGANRGIVLEEQYEHAVMAGDELEAKDIKYDSVHNYLMPRIKYGRFDMVMKDVEELKNMSMGEQGLADLKDQGLANINDNISTYHSRLDILLSTANNLKNIYESINLRYSGEVIEKEDGTQYRKYSPEVIEKLTYAAGKISNYDVRIPLVNSTLSEYGIDTLSVIEGIINENKPNREAVDEALKTINSLNVTSDIKTSLKSNLTDVIELSLRKQAFLQEYDDIKRKPLNYTTDSDFAPGDSSNLDVIVKQKEKKEGQRAVTIDKPLEIGKQYSLKENILKEGNILILAPKLSVLSQTLGGEFEVRLPNGKIVFITPTEFKKYNIAEENNTSQELSDVMDRAIENVLKTPEFKEIKDVYDKIEGDFNKLDFINNFEDDKLINAVQKEFSKQSKEFIERRVKEKELAERLLKNKEQLEQQQKEIELQSGTIATGDSNNVPFEAEKRKEASILFTSGTTESEDTNDPTQSAPHIKRSREFLNNISNHPKRGNMRAILVTAEQSEKLGLKGLTQLSFGVDENIPFSEIPYDVLNPELGFVAQVFVIQEKGKTYFVDKDGNKLSQLGKQVDLNKVIFQTMPTTLLHYANGGAKFRDSQETEAKAYAKAYTEYRKDLFSKDGINPPIFNFIISKGFPIENTLVDGTKERNHIGGILIDEDKISTEQGLLIIPTTGYISYNGESIKFPNGVPILKHGSTLQYLNNKKFNKQEASVIYNVINALAKDIIEQSEKGERIRINRYYSDFLQNILYWKSKGKETTSPNQISIDISNLTINLGNKSYPITTLYEHGIEIVDQLQEAFNAINNSTLTKLFNKPFIEFIDDELNIRTWENYQTYLLSSKFPDGKSRGTEVTPLVTSVAAPTESIPYSFKQKYATLEGMELNISLPKEQPSTNKNNVKNNIIENHVLDGETENIYKLSGDRPVLFTGTLENNDVVVIIKSNNTTKTIASNKKTINEIIVPKLKELQGKEFNASLEDEEYVFQYLGNAIASDLQNKFNVKKPEEAPKEEIPNKEEPNNTEYDSNNTSGPSEEFRKIGTTKVERISDEEIEIFKQWHSENVPNIPYDILENIITDNNGEKAWGVFENGIAKFVRGGLRATEYHEIFEAIYKGMLTLDEQQALLNEFKSKKGQFTDRQSSKKIFYAEATDKQAKERIADDFADFRQGKLPARSLGEKINRFFKAIVDFFKSFVQTPSLKKQLFKAIDEGTFKNIKLSPSVYNEFAEYRAISGLTEQQTHEFIQDMTARAAGILYRDGEKGLLFKSLSITGKEMFSKIEELYNKEGKRQELGDEKWNELKQRTLQSLRTLGINFNEEDVLTINEEGRNQKDYSPSPFSTDWKKYSSGAIKFSLGTLLETVNTNQQNRLTLEVPKALTTSVKGYKLLNFSRAFATTLDKLTNTTGVTKMVDKLFDLAKYDGNYVRLLQRVGVDMNGNVDFGKFDNNDWRYFIQFTQTFTKQKPEALIQYNSIGEIYTAPSNLFSIIKETQSDWIENIKVLSKNENSLIIFNKLTKTFVVNTVKLKDLPLRSAKNKIEMLGELGIIFPLDVYNRLKTEKIGNNRSTDQDKFNDAVSAIYNYLGENNNIMSVKGKTLGINGPLSTLAELYVKVTNPNQENTHFGIDGERRNNYSENNYTSVFENEFNESETLDDLLQKRPELYDIFSRNSQILKEGGLFFDKNRKRIRQLKVKYIQGTKSIIDGSHSPINKMNLGDRFTQEINQNINGNYYILMPADGSTEWMLDLGNQIDFSEIENGKGWNKILKIFRGYLMDDVVLALDGNNRKHLKNIKDRREDLRFFKDILFEKELNEINKLIKGDATQSEIEEYINNNIDAINDSIKEFINATVKETRDILESTRNIVQFDDGKFSYLNLDSTFSDKESLEKTNLSDKSINDILTFTNINYIINNIEFHKVLFGDPYQFAIKKDGSLDETKRIKSFLSPRRTTFDSPELNTFLNQNKNTIDGIELQPGDPGYHEFKSYTNTVTIKDNVIVGSLSNIIKKYESTDETDGFSWLMDGTYREIKIKNGQWSDEAEDFHQWQMAYTRQKLEKFNYKYSSEALKKHDEKLIKNPSPKHQIEVIKPIVTGNKHNKTQIELILDKFAQVPVYYSMVEDTSLEKLYIHMFNNNNGYAIVQQGRKVGQEDAYSLYNQDGSFNGEDFNNIVQVPWKAYGIQVETASEGEKFQTRGSQITKISTMDLFDNGIAITEEAQKEYNRNIDILDKMHTNAYNELLNNLGVKEDNGEFFLEDSTKISNTLMYEMLRREVSDNTKDAIQLDENNEFPIPFEATPSYVQIRNIIYSMIDKAILSPKMNGAPHVQIPVTMFEKASKGRSLTMKNADGQWEKITKQQYTSLSEEDKKKVMLTDDTLKFYEDADGKRYMEIMLPHWFKNKFGNKTDEQILKYLNTTSEGQKILMGIGFRIPTQAQSSIDIFRVKGFLPQYMGTTVVVPSEITTKAGSDFDIDKLNIYLKSVYVDKSGNIKLIQYKGSEEATKEFFGKVFDENIKTEIERINKFNEFRVELFSILDALESTETILLEEQRSFYNVHLSIIDEIISQADNIGLIPSEYMMKQIEKLADKESELNNKLLSDILRENYIKEMYKKSLENEYYDSLEKLITLPENFNRLISPVDDSGLKELSKKLDNLRGYNESNIKNRILNRNYMTKLRSSFLMGKKWIGIAAVSITNLSLKQKSQVYIDTSKINALPENDKKWLKDGNVLLKHNTTIVDEKEVISLSGIKVKNEEQYISGRYSGYATSFVDIANDDYITKVIQSDLLVGTFMFLENIGSGEQGVMFLNQPIIDEYIKYLDSIGTKNLFNNKAINYIKSKFITNNKLIDSVGIDLNNLEQNIENYYKKSLTEAQNAEQHNILDEFLKYAKMAQFNFKFTQSTNYDTSSFRNAETLTRKQWSTDNNEKDNIISSVKNILDSTFIGKQATLLDGFVEAMGSIFKLDKREFKIITDGVLKPYGDNQYLSNDKYEKIANKIKLAFLDYVIQTKSGINKQIKELLVDGSGVANRLEQAKKSYPQFQILQDLEIVSGERQDGAKSIKLKTNIKEAYDENLYTGYMRELRDFGPTNQLYKDLILTSILQGSYQSAISIRNIIPIEDYGNIVSPIIQQLIADKSLDAFNKGFFQRNNFRDPEIMPVFQPKFFMLNDGIPVAEEVTSFGDFYADVFQYYSSLFPNIQALNLKSSDRHILLLSEQFNSFNLKDDFIKIPRVVTDRKTGDSIDMKTGLTITKMSYVKMKQKGDPSLYDVYGYAKVKYADGSPLIIMDKKIGEQYVYKLINLYGDGERASEYYQHMNPSVIDNGTIKTSTEITDAYLVELYGGEVAQKDVSLPIETLEEGPSFDIVSKIAELKDIKENVVNESTEMKVVNAMPKILPESARKETGLNTGNTQDISVSLLSKNGVTVDQAANDIWQELFIDSAIETSDIRNIIIDVLNSGSKKNYTDGIDGTNEIQELESQLKNAPKIKTTKSIKINPDQLNLFDVPQEDSWKDEDNNDTCVPF